jgi:hypothetical protein
MDQIDLLSDHLLQFEECKRSYDSFAIVLYVFQVEYFLPRERYLGKGYT